MELAAALHHSRDGGRETHYGLRAPKTASSGGRRPGVLEEPEPPVVVEHAACPCSGAPLLVVPSLAAAESDGVDGTSLKYLLKLALKENEKEEERMRREEEAAARSELISLIRVPQEHRTADQERRITDVSRILSAAHKRKRKKKRKKKLPKSSSSCGRARRRQRQWHGWISSNDEICADYYTYFRFMLKGKGRSVQWEVFLFCDKTIKVDRDYAEVLPLGVPLPDIGGVGFGSSPNFVTNHTIYELCLPSERGCVSLSCGGGGFPPDGAYTSIWDSVRPITGKYFVYYFQYQEVVECICLLNVWFSSNDEICADNYMYSRFKLQDKCRSEKWEVFLFGDKSIKVDCVCVEVLPKGVPPLRFFTQLGNGSHHFWFVPAFERGMGMIMPLAVPVSSGKFSGTCASTAPAVDLLRCPSQSLWQEAPSMLLQLPCPCALLRQTALALRLQCAAQVLTPPCRVMVEVSPPVGAVHGLT